MKKSIPSSQKEPQGVEIKTEPVNDSDLAVRSAQNLMACWEPPTVSQSRPYILHSVAEPALRTFVTSFMNYQQMGGTHSARSFLHSDVIEFFLNTGQTNFRDENFEDSSAVLSVLRSHYAPRRTDYFDIMKELKMVSADPNTFDKGAVNDYNP